MKSSDKKIKKITYAKYVKDNKIPKANQSTIVPKHAHVINHGELPIGVEYSLSKTDGDGFDTYTVLGPGKPSILLMYCRKEHGHWFTWN